jgi:hypothetical protein
VVPVPFFRGTLKRKKYAMYENLHILWIHRNVNNSFKCPKPLGFDVLYRLIRSRTKDVHTRKKKFMSNFKNNHYCYLMKKTEILG